jgi:hypothetical protein
MSEYNENTKGAWLLNDAHFMKINNKWPPDPAIAAAAAGQGNLTDAWFGGGSSPSIVSTLDRIIFASDTATAVAKGPLSVSRSGTAASGNSTDAWFGGGSDGNVSTVDRIIFASDTATAVEKGPLSLARHSSAASGNSTDAWFGGGIGPTPADGSVSTVDRIIFASDTATAVAKGPLSNFPPRLSLAASGNSTDAWFGGGSGGPFPGITSRVDRIIFASDTANAVMTIIFGKRTFMHQAILQMLGLVWTPGSHINSNLCN